MQSAMGAILAVVYANYFVKAFAGLPASEADQLSDEAAQQIIGSYQGAQSVAESFPQAQSEQIIDAANKAFTEGKSVAYTLALVLILFAAGLVAWKYPKREAEEQFFAKIAEQSAQDEAKASTSDRQAITSTLSVRATPASIRR